MGITTKKVFWNGEKRFILFKYNREKYYFINETGNARLSKFEGLGQARKYLKLKGAR